MIYYLLLVKRVYNYTVNTFPAFEW